MILFKIIFKGSGFIVIPVATIFIYTGESILFLVNKITLQGEYTIGQKAVAITNISFLRKRMYLNISFLPAAFSSILNVGEIVNLLNPQLNSIRDFEGTISLFSSILFTLKCIVETLHSCGNKVERIKGLFKFCSIY